MKTGIGTSIALATCLSVALTCLPHTYVITFGVALLLGGSTTKRRCTEHNALGTVVETALVLVSSIWALEYLGRSYCGGTWEILKALLVAAGAFSATGLIGYSDTLRYALRWTKGLVVPALMIIVSCGIFALGITLVEGLQAESVNGRLLTLGQCPTPEMLRGYGHDPLELGARQLVSGTVPPLDWVLLSATGCTIALCAIGGRREGSKLSVPCGMRYGLVASAPLAGWLAVWAW